MNDVAGPRRARPHRLAIPAALLAAIWFFMLSVGAGPADGRLLAAIYLGGDSTLVPLARAVTTLGDPEVVIGLSLAAALWLWHSRGFRDGLTLLIVTLVGRALVSAQKFGIERFRPDDHEKLVHVSTPSFPSGHAAGSLIFYLTLALILARGTRWKLPAIAAALVLAFLVGMSRMWLGVHWPTDVVGGWAFGLLWVALALPLAERLVGSKARAKAGR